MKIEDIEYPLRLCVEMMHYCAISNDLTKDKTASEIKEALAFFFNDEQIEDASKILCTGTLTQETELLTPAEVANELMGNAHFIDDAANTLAESIYQPLLEEIKKNRDDIAKIMSVITLLTDKGE